MPENGKLIGLVVAIAGSLKGVSEVIRAIRERSRGAGLPRETAVDLADALEKVERELFETAAELAECVARIAPVEKA